MPRATFKAPAPPPPTTPRVNRTPMKATSKKDTLATSTLIGFDDLMRDGSVFFDGGEKEFLKFVRSVKVLQRNHRGAKEQLEQSKRAEQSQAKEIEALSQRLKQAQQLLNQEMQKNSRIQSEKDMLQSQWAALQDLVNKEPQNSKINHETLDRIQRSFSSVPSINVQRTASARRNYYQPRDNQMEPLVENESLCDASDLFDDDSRDDILDASTKRRSSNIRMNKRR